MRQQHPPNHPWTLATKLSQTQKHLLLELGGYPVVEITARIGGAVNSMRGKGLISLESMDLTEKGKETAEIIWKRYKHRFQKEEERAVTLPSSDEFRYLRKQVKNLTNLVQSLHEKFDALAAYDEAA